MNNKIKGISINRKRVVVEHIPVQSTLKHDGMVNKIRENQSLSSRNDLQIPSFSSLLTDKSCISMRKSLNDGLDMSKFNYRKLTLLATHLRELIYDCLQKKDFEGAKSAEKDKNKVLEIMKTLNNNICNNREEVDKSKKIHQYNMDKIESSLEKFDENTKLKLENIKKRQIKELQEFELKWSTHKVGQYRKPSKHLLDLHYRQRNSAVSRDIKNTMIYEYEIEKVKRQETMNSVDRMISDYKCAKKQLIAQQQQQIQRYIEKRDNYRKLIESEKSRELNLHEKRLKKIDNFQKKHVIHNVKPLYNTSQLKWNTEYILPSPLVKEEACHSIIQSKLSNKTRDYEIELENIKTLISASSKINSSDKNVNLYNDSNKSLIEPDELKKNQKEVKDSCCSVRNNGRYTVPRLESSRKNEEDLDDATQSKEISLSEMLSSKENNSPPMSLNNINGLEKTKIEQKERKNKKRVTKNTNQNPNRRSADCISTSKQHVEGSKDGFKTIKYSGAKSDKFESYSSKFVDERSLVRVNRNNDTASCKSTHSSPLSTNSSLKDGKDLISPPVHKVNSINNSYFGDGVKKNKSHLEEENNEKVDNISMNTTSA